MAKHRADHTPPMTKAQRKAAKDDTQRHEHLAQAVRLMAVADRKRRQAVARAKYEARKAAKGK